MPQKAKPTTLQQKLHSYRYKYLNFKYTKLDESSTRVIVNHLLSDVLGYSELTEIKTEYPVPGGYIDYLIEVSGKKRFVVEVKPITSPLTTKHLRQALYYAAIMGIDWIILTNAREIELYRLTFSKPIKVEKIISLDMQFTSSQTTKLMSFLTRRSVINNELKLILENPKLTSGRI